MKRRSLLAGAIAAPMIRVESKGDAYDPEALPYPDVEITRDPSRFGLWVTAWAACVDPVACAEGKRWGLRTFVLTEAWTGDVELNIAKASCRLARAVMRAVFEEAARLGKFDT